MLLTDNIAEDAGSVFSVEYLVHIIPPLLFLPFHRSAVPPPFQGGKFFPPLKGEVSKSTILTEGFTLTTNYLLLTTAPLTYLAPEAPISSIYSKRVRHLFSVIQCRRSCVAQTFPLMLLGLPPDMVRGVLSHRTRTA